MSKISVATWEGSFNILGVKVRCYVVDGKRIINAEDMRRLFEAGADYHNMNPPTEFADFVQWCRSDA